MMRKILEYSNAENVVYAIHDFTEIQVRVLRSKGVLEKCKKGRLFLVVGAERDSSCKRLLATSYRRE